MIPPAGIGFIGVKEIVYVAAAPATYEDYYISGRVSAPGCRFLIRIAAANPLTFPLAAS